MLKRMQTMFKINDTITSSENTQEDSYSVFKKAVNNGQTRLALEALVDVIDAIIDTLTGEEDFEEQKPMVESTILEPQEKVEEKIETPIAKKKTKDSSASTPS